MPNSSIRERDFAQVLVIDDWPPMVELIEGILQAQSDIRVHSCLAAETALTILESEDIDVAISDVRMPGIDGFGFLKRAQEIDPCLDVLLMSGFSSVSDAVRSIQHGAVNYIAKPFDPADLLKTVRELVAARRRRSQPSREFETAVLPILGHSPALVRVLAQIQQYSAYSAPVLIRGETGTGKELVARAIHDAGPRAKGPYLVCNCSAFSDELVSTEFFGHAKGAFTDADEARQGLFEMADGGVLFLDEIADLSLSSQGKILRALENGQIQRVGETRTRTVDVQIIAAMNKDLAQEVREGRFRKDLYYRLNVSEIVLPPLRDRPDDIALLVDKFLGEFAAEYGKPKPTIDRDALQLLQQYSWPGNIRELRNFVQRHVLFHSGGTLEVGDLSAEAFIECPVLATDHTLEAARREHICRVLNRFDGNKTAAARVLGVSRLTLYREIKRYGL